MGTVPTYFMNYAFIASLIILDLHSFFRYEVTDSTTALEKMKVFFCDYKLIVILRVKAFARLPIYPVAFA